MDCWPVTVFSQIMHINKYIQLFDGNKKSEKQKKECVGLPLEENRRSPFENLLVFLLHGATGLDLSQPFKKRGKDQIQIFRLETRYRSR